MYAIPVTSIQHVCITIGDDGDGGWVNKIKKFACIIIE